MTFPTSYRSGVLALTCLAALGLGLGACDDGGDTAGGDVAPPPPATGTADPATPPGAAPSAPAGQPEQGAAPAQ